MKISKWWRVAAFILIIALLIPTISVFALDKNYRQAGLVDDMSSKRFMKSYENIVFSGQGVEAEKGESAVIEYQLADEFSFGNIYYEGNSRNDYFAVGISDNGKDFTEVYKGEGDGSTTSIVPHEFADTVRARYVRLYVKGNNTSKWNSVSEVKIYGDF